MEALGTIKQGTYGVTDIFTEQRKYDKDKSKFFIWRERGYAQLVHTLITIQSKVSVDDPEPKHFEDGYRPMKIALTGLTIAAPSGSAPETVDITFTTGGTTPNTDVNNFQVSQTWENGTIFMSDVSGTTTTFSTTRGISGANNYFKHEVMEVLAVNTSTGVVTFRRHIGVDTRVGTTVAPATTHTLYLHSTAATDGAGAPVSFTQSPVVVNNYTQEFKEPYEITDKAQKTDIFGENEWQRKARSARKNFARQLDRAFLAGHKYKRTDSGELKYFMGGIEEWIPEDTDHQIDFAAPPTATLLNTNAKGLFDQGSGEKWGICGAGALTKVGNAFSDGLRFNDKLSTMIGMEVKDFTQSAGGTLHLVQDYEMSQTNKDNEVFIIDVPYLSYMYLDSEDIHIDKGKAGVGLQATDETKTKYQITGTVGMKRTFRDAHYHWYGLS